MSAERSLKTHLLEVSVIKGCEECYRNFLIDPEGRKYCGSYMQFSCYEFSLTCPGGPRDQRDCALWMECDHIAPSDDSYPCDREMAGEQMCIAWDGQCDQCLKAAIAEDEWYDTHPHGQYCPSDGCWAQEALHWDGDLVSSMGDIPLGFDGTYLGTWNLHVDNTGGFEEMALEFYLPKIAA